jgi:hypothetical protein
VSVPGGPNKIENNQNQWHYLVSITHKVSDQHLHHEYLRKNLELLHIYK